MVLWNGLEKEVQYPNEELVKCTYKDCKNYGEHIFCYFDVYQNCEIYMREENKKEKK